MKKSVISLLVSLFSICLLSGCEDRIWDIAPVDFRISVTDANGVDLLRPGNPHAIDVTKVKAIYKGQEFECSTGPSDAKTKAYMPHFHGLRLLCNTYYNIYLLEFGELDGAESYTNESLTIVWPDGSRDEVSFNRDFQWRHNDTPYVKEEWFLNNSKVSSGIIKIVK